MEFDWENIELGLKKLFENRWNSGRIKKIINGLNF